MRQFILFVFLSLFVHSNIFSRTEEASEVLMTGCSAPMTISVGTFSESAVTITWPAVSGAGWFIFEYRIAGSFSWISGGSSGGNTVTKSFTGLTPNTTYEVRGKIYCSNPNSSSEWSAPVFFTTAPPQLMSISVVSVTETSVSITWPAISGAGWYEFECRLVGASAWTPLGTLTGSATSKTYSGLNQNSFYEIRGRIYYTNPTSTSDWSVPVSYTTNGSQTSMLTLNPGYDTYVASNSSSSSYPNENILSVGEEDGVFRIYTKFDLESVPSNAIILGAKVFFKVKSENENVENESFTIQKVIEPWDPSTVNFENQPKSQHEDRVKNSNLNTNMFRYFEVTDHVKDWISGKKNEGWMMAADNEEGGNSFADYYSQNESLAEFRPRLEIQYSIPFNFAGAVVVHASSSTSTDGQVSANVTGGSSSMTFTWYDGYNGNVISGQTTSTLSNIGYGWYGLKIQDNIGDPKYIAFIVGAMDESKDISFSPGANYIDDTKLVDGPISGGVSSGVYSRSNYGADRLMLIRDWYNIREKGLIKFCLWADSRLEFEKADLEFQAGTHVNNSHGNMIELSLVKEDWKEYQVTWNTTPSYSDELLNFIPESANNTEDKTINMVPYWEYWKSNNDLNYGVLMEIPNMNLSNRRMIFYSADDANSNLNPKMEFTVRVDRGYISDFDEQTELGSIDVDLVEIPNKIGPYFYRLSTEPIPEITAEYELIRDSLYAGNLDSTQFFVGDSNQLKTFSNLPMGTYYLAVFDNTKTRIINNTINLSGKLALKDNSGMIVADDEFISVLPNSSSFLDVFVSDQSKSQSTYEPEDLVSKQIFGFVNPSATSSNTIGDYGFAFQIENNQISALAQGLNVATLPITSSAFKLLFDHGTVTYKMGETTIHTATMGVDQIYRGGVYAVASEKITKHTYLSHKKKRFQIGVKDIIHHKCDGQTGSFKFYATPSYFPIVYNDWESETSFSMTGYEYSWTINKGGTIVQYGSSGPQTSPYTIQPNNYFTASTGPGIYTIVINVVITFGNAPNAIFDFETISKTVYVGYETEWINNNNRYDLTPNNFSIQRNTLDPGTFAYARSKNVYVQGSNPGSLNWIHFKPVVVSSGISNGDLMRVSTQGLSTTQPIYTDPYSLNFYKSGSNVRLLVQNLSPNGSPQVTPFTLSSNSEIAVHFWNNSMQIFSNNVPLGTFTKTNSTIVLRANSEIHLEGFDDVVTSFDCSPTQPANTTSYTELKRKLDGGFGLAVGDIVKFTFDEEYDINSSLFLPFTIYDNIHNVIAKTDLSGNVVDGQNSPITSVSNQIYQNVDDNRYEIDISGISGFIVDQFYVIEVETTAGDKLFMKFRYKN